MNYLIPITVGIITGAAVQAAFFRYTLRHRTRRQEAPNTEMLAQIGELERAVRASLCEPDSVISTTSLGFFQAKRESVLQEVARIKADCDRISEKLQTQQRAAQELELAQQSLKTARADDEAALDEILSQFSTTSEEAAQLELQLANSQQQLEDLLEQVELTKPQRKFLEELQEAMRTAGETLRQLLEEYREVQERLETVTSQQEALELEYTTLVEKLLA
jgi:chromosome segregation ATPase